MVAAAYRSTFGIAKDSVNATLTAAVAASATTLPVSNTTIAASSTLTIIDGPNTEQCVVSAGGGTASLTVGALAHAHPANCYITSQLTSALGPADYIPLTVIEPEDTINQLHDQGLRGSAVDTYGSVQGMRYSQFSVGGDVFPDLIPWWIGGVTGAVDFSGGTPNTHAFSVKNTGDTQPTPFSLWDFNAIDTRIYAGAKVEEVALKWDPSALFTYTSKISSYMSGPVAATTASFTSGTTLPAPSWLCQATLGGSATGVVMSADATLKRSLTVINTLQGIQDPYKIWLGQFSIDGTLNLVMEDNTHLNNFLNNSQPAIDLLWTATGSNPKTVQLHCTKANYETSKPKQTGGGGFVELAVTFTGLATTSDATTAGTGYSPGKITVGTTAATGKFQ